VNSKPRHFSPAEAAERLGVSVKALRIYERRGMVAPLRTAAGWRAYGPDQIARLHQVLALKSLGLPLARIAELVAEKPVDLDALLALQEEALASQRRRLDQAIGLLRTARTKLKAGEGLSIDDLTTLAKETTMSDQEMKTVFKPIIDKHFTETDRPALAAAQAGGYDQAQITAEWNALFAECRVLAEKGDPTTPEAMDLARRWMAQVGKFTGGDPSLFQKSAAVWKDAMNDPDVAPRLPASPEMFAFIAKAEAARKAAQG
jgi:DNA-binding transcriptional MerR regulator